MVHYIHQRILIRHISGLGIALIVAVRWGVIMDRMRGKLRRNRKNSSCRPSDNLLILLIGIVALIKLIAVAVLVQRPDR